jgi:predicted GNAT family acetyltransferase
MVQIPLDSFRILDKKFGWEKSFKELVDDDDNDIALIREAINASKERFIDSDKEKLGEWDGSSQDISKVWLQYFMLQMRINVKSTYMLTGVNKRGIPKNLAENHVLHMNEMKKLAEDLFITNTYVHIIFLFWHLYDQESHRGEKQYFELLFENHYIDCVKTAYGVALEHPMFSSKTVDFKRIESKLRDNSQEFFVDLWKTANNES